MGLFAGCVDFIDSFTGNQVNVTDKDAWLLARLPAVPWSQSAPKTCLPLPQPELEGIRGSQGAVANSTGSGSCRTWWFVQKQRGSAALGSRILVELPHMLPEGKGYRQLRVSKSLGKQRKDSQGI